jgi:hypothetical protein
VGVPLGLRDEILLRDKVLGSELRTVVGEGLDRKMGFELGTIVGISPGVPLGSGFWKEVAVPLGK